MNNSMEIQQSVTAILKTDNKLKAVELLKENGSFKILWAKSTKENDLNWQAFVSRASYQRIEGETPSTQEQEHITSNNNVVVGYDSTGTAFYQVNVPAVEEKEISSIVQFQAESRFPLPADQMELAWRTNKLPNNQMAITIAAARRKQIQNFVDKVSILCPERAILDSEGIVKAWKELFFGKEKNVIIVNAGTHNTQICLVENGLLCNAVTLDIGTVDFGESESQEDTETIERLVRDIRSVVDLFGLEKQFEIPVIVLSDGGKIYKTLTASLKSVGLNARPAIPSTKKLNPDNKLNSKELFEYRAPIGLALKELDGETDDFHLFSNLFKPVDEKVKKHWFYSPTITSVIAAIMVLLFVMVSYAEIAGSSRVINKKLSNLGSENDINTLVNKQKLLKEIANQRADLIALLNDITQSGQNNPNAQTKPGTPTVQPPMPQPGPPGQSGIELESFHFKKNKQVTITGTAQKKEQLEIFEKSLSSNRDITNVHLTPKPNTGTTNNRNQPNNRGSVNNNRGSNPQPQPPPMPPGNPGGSGNKGFSFTITFNYKNFTTSPRR